LLDKVQNCLIFCFPNLKEKDQAKHPFVSFTGVIAVFLHNTVEEKKSKIVMKRAQKYKKMVSFNAGMNNLLLVLFGKGKHEKTTLEIRLDCWVGATFFVSISTNFSFWLHIIRRARTFTLLY